jgi:nucleoside-diphosphate-sugar epimerase
VFNLGVGEQIRIGDLADRIVRKVGRPVEIVVTPERLRPDRSEVLRLISDNSLAREQLGWQPEISLDQGLDRTIDWISKNIERYQPGIYQF